VVPHMMCSVEDDNCHTGMPTSERDYFCQECVGGTLLGTNPLTTVSVSFCCFQVSSV